MMLFMCHDARRIWGFCWGVSSSTPQICSIGKPVAATDIDNDPLTYHLSGTDAAAFDIDSATGQLTTKAAHNYNAQTDYTVTVTVSDGNLIAEIPVTINVIGTATETPTNSTPRFVDGNYTQRTIAENTAKGVNIGKPVAATDADNDALTYALSGPDAKSFGIDNTTAQLKTSAELDYETKNTYTVTITASDGNVAITITVIIIIIDLDDQKSPTLTLTSQPLTDLTETTLNGEVVTLTLKDGLYESQYTVGNSLTVSGINGVTIDSFNVKRLSDTQVNVGLIFDGTDFDTEATLTFTLGANAIVGYNGTALTTQLPVSAVVEKTPTITAYYPSQALTEATLDESIVTLTLSTGVYTQSSADISSALQVSGIDGVTFLESDVTRLSDTKITIKLTFDRTDFDTNGILTFTLGADALTNYDGPALITAILVTAVVEERPTITASVPQPLTEATLNGSMIRLTLNNGTYVRSNSDIDSTVSVSGIAGVTVGFFGIERVSDTIIIFELEFTGNIDSSAALIFTVEADAIAEYDGPARIAQIVVNGGQESVVAATEAPLTEATLDGSIVTITLNGAAYERSEFDIRDAVTVSGIEGATFRWFGLDRVSDTELTVELTFKGNIDTDAILTFTIGAGAIAGYNGPEFTAQVSVTADRENALLANFPNPFNPETWIPYQLAKPTEVTITIYAMNGQIVRTLTLGYQPAGSYQTRSRAAYWDGRNAFGEPVASGVYFYTLIADNFTATRKMLIRK